MKSAEGFFQSLKEANILSDKNIIKDGWDEDIMNNGYCWWNANKIAY